MRRLLPALVMMLLTLSARADTVGSNPAIVEVVSPGGIVAWLRHDKSVPLIAIDFQFWAAGSVPEETTGAATLASRMLTAGAGPWDGEAFRQTLADNAIGLSFEASRDRFSGSVTTLAANRELAARLLQASLAAPHLDDAALRQQKARLVSERRRSETRPEAIAYRTWFRLTFPGHPFGRSVRGTPESIAALEVASVRAFLGRVLTRNGLIIGVAGDIAPEELAAFLDVAFGGLPDHDPPPPAPRPPPPTAGIAVLPHGSPQSVVVFGHAGVPRSDPDWYAAMVVNQVLGGSAFSSRLGSEVREKRGLAYGIGTGLSPLGEGALLLGRTASANEAVGEAVSIIRAEWLRMVENGPTPEELADAKTYLIGSFPLSLDSTGAIAAALVDMQDAGLPRDYWSRRAAVIAAVDLEAARRVSRRLLVPKDLLFVAVGMPTGLVPTIALPQ